MTAWVALMHRIARQKTFIISAETETVNCFKTRLDNFWKNQDSINIIIIQRTENRSKTAPVVTCKTGSLYVYVYV